MTKYKWSTDSESADKIVVHFRHQHKVLLALLDPDFVAQANKFREGTIPFETTFMLTNTIYEDRLGQEASDSLLESCFGTKVRKEMLAEIVRSGEGIPSPE
ncbi:hypothetical protein FVE85_8054 [Porphyridium purpureum]|uniref:Ribosome maturation protein SDO1/SBDS N-terminal domain-containing protein n=1 Tax=Porphyridium purpureum TaxID=35688 RepID=A0A5J4YQ86_PORPP|nr:hypothetical protein FVE85_8054 [Porphyridium purpureum]|eukprot:POR0201..scf295_9